MFDPSAPLAKLTAGRITIDDEGYLDIGSMDCPFTGNAEILLTGQYIVLLGVIVQSESKLKKLKMFILKEPEMMIRIMIPFSDQNFLVLKPEVLLKFTDHTKDRGLNWKER